MEEERKGDGASELVLWIIVMGLGGLIAHDSRYAGEAEIIQFFVGLGIMISGFWKFAKAIS